MLVQAQVVPWWGTGRPAELSPSGFQPVTGIAYRQEDRRIQRPRAEHYTRFREIRNSNFLVPPPLGGRSVREITSREETERPPENRLGRSQHAPACPGNRKPAGGLARQVGPLPSRSRRHLDYESSSSPRPSRSYR